MNYYVTDYRRCSKTLDRKLIECADEIVSLYMSGSGRRESLRKTQKYMEYLEQYLLGKYDPQVPFYKRLAQLKAALPKRLHVDAEPIAIELEVAYRRVECMRLGDHTDELGYDHNVRFVDAMLRIFNLIERSGFHDSYKNYLDSADRFFSAAEERKYKGRKMLFYRNAYRAEKYSHKLYSDPHGEGTCDMYTPLILSRMAVEQYLKYMYELKFSMDAPSKPSECREKLEAQKCISRSLSNELWAVLKRGNANTHEGYAGYVFANMHCIAVLKMCFEELQSH